MEAEKQATAALVEEEEEKSGPTTEIRELPAEINEELEARSARVSDVEWKEQLAQLREDLLRISRMLGGRGMARQRRHQS